MRIAPILLGVFFAFATCILVSVGLALLFPGTSFETIWRLYEARRAMLMPYRTVLGPGFLMLAVVMAAAFLGNFARADWGRRLAIGIFAGSGIGDVVQLFLGHIWEGLIGIAFAAALLVWLTRPATKALYG
ncbi:MAG TPA: hypothetical protein VLT91_01470 [Rhizomicrobium sp.]|nr:hypothetical protein [Rhizomicrobium sp.]